MLNSVVAHYDSRAAAPALAVHCGYPILDNGPITVICLPVFEHALDNADERAAPRP
jgi:hypothetical protein